MLYVRILSVRNLVVDASSLPLNIFFRHIKSNISELYPISLFSLVYSINKWPPETFCVGGKRVACRITLSTNLQIDSFVIASSRMVFQVYFSLFLSQVVSLPRFLLPSDSILVTNSEEYLCVSLAILCDTDTVSLDRHKSRERKRQSNNIYTWSKECLVFLWFFRRLLFHTNHFLLCHTFLCSFLLDKRSVCFACCFHPSSCSCQFLRTRLSWLFSNFNMKCPGDRNERSFLSFTSCLLLSFSSVTSSLHLLCFAWSPSLLFSSTSVYFSGIIIFPAPPLLSFSCFWKLKRRKKKKWRGNWRENKLCISQFLATDRLTQNDILDFSFWTPLGRGWQGRRSWKTNGRWNTTREKQETKGD